MTEQSEPEGMTRREFGNDGVILAGIVGLVVGLPFLAASINSKLQGKSDTGKKYLGNETFKYTLEGTITDMNIKERHENLGLTRVEDFYVEVASPQNHRPFEEHPGRKDYVAPRITKWFEVSHKEYADLMRGDKVKLDFSVTFEKYQSGNGVIYEKRWESQIGTFTYTPPTRESRAKQTEQQPEKR